MAKTSNYPIRMSDDERAELERLADLLSQSEGKRVVLSKVVRKCLDYGKRVLEEELQSGVVVPSAAKSDTARIHSLLTKVVEHGLKSLNLPS